MIAQGKVLIVNTKNIKGLRGLKNLENVWKEQKPCFDPVEFFEMQFVALNDISCFHCLNLVKKKS